MCSDYLELAVDMRSIMLATGRYEPAQGTTCHVEIVGKGEGEDGGGRGGEEEAGVGEAGVGVPKGVPSAVAWGGLTHERARMKWLSRRPYFVGTERDQVRFADVLLHPSPLDHHPFKRSRRPFGCGHSGDWVLVIGLINIERGSPQHRLVFWMISRFLAGRRPRDLTPFESSFAEW
jgi:hypothetical protein